jgi:hypothetical protein
MGPRAAAAFAQLKKLTDGDSETLAQKLRAISGAQGPMLENLLRLQFTNVHNTLVLVPGRPFQPSLWGTPGAYPRVEHLKGASLG